jgi:hypothetical protein
MRLRASTSSQLPAGAAPDRTGDHLVNGCHSAVATDSAGSPPNPHSFNLFRVAQSSERRCAFHAFAQSAEMLRASRSPGAESIPGNRECFTRLVLSNGCSLVFGNGTADSDAGHISPSVLMFLVAAFTPPRLGQRPSLGVRPAPLASVPNRQAGAAPARSLPQLPACRPISATRAAGGQT